MSEVLENPVIRISGSVSEKEYKAALRARNVRVFLKLTAVYVSLMLVMTIGTSMYYAYPYIRSGEITYGEWLGELWDSLCEGMSPYIFVSFILLYAAILFLIDPIRFGKRFNEIYPNSMPVEYVLYENRLVMTSVSRSAESTDRLYYSDVKHKIRENGHAFRLSTGKKNKYTLFKCVMTPEEVTSVRELLKTHCPQHK
jgi:hypothetical protein